MTAVLELIGRFPNSNGLLYISKKPYPQFLSLGTNALARAGKVIISTYFASLYCQKYYLLEI